MATHLLIDQRLTAMFREVKERCLHCHFQYAQTQREMRGDQLIVQCQQINAAQHLTTFLPAVRMIVAYATPEDVEQSVGDQINQLLLGVHIAIGYKVKGCGALRKQERFRERNVCLGKCLATSMESLFLAGPCGDCVELSELRDSSRCNEAVGAVSVVSVELPNVSDSKVSCMSCVV